MTQELVHNVRLGCIIRAGNVSDVLCGAEDLKSQAVQELPLAENAGDRLNSESCSFFEVLDEFA